MDDVEQRYDELFDRWLEEEDEKPEFSKQEPEEQIVPNEKGWYGGIPKVLEFEQVCQACNLLYPIEYSNHQDYCDDCYSKKGEEKNVLL